MFQYVIRFSKTGTICYTSHLDLMRMFKRAFKRAGIKLAYSQGFNPHPKMGFAQPLSLGYWGLKELMEFETTEDHEPSALLKGLKEQMPEGIELVECRRLEGIRKTLAAETVSAEYIVAIPLERPLEQTGEQMKEAYLSCEKISAWKRQKKKKDLKEIDIKPMIREITFTPEEETLFITAVLDSGSVSNLSPELVIATVQELFHIRADRSEVEVMRREIGFNPGVME
ncbi:MAG: TIGR03936 family radical SAM-associated protein [Bacillota bacterium]|nr:TIGR03936 family radical SAM-associated protein [Bacillota bacterium]